MRPRQVINGSRFVYSCIEFKLASMHRFSSILANRLLAFVTQIIEGIVTILAVGAVLFLPNPPEITETLSTPEMEELQRQGTSTSDSSYTYDLQSRRASIPMPPPPPGLPPMRPDSLSIHSEDAKTREKFFNPEERATFDNWITRDDECRGIPESLRKHWWTPSLTDLKTYLFLVVNV